MNSSNRPGTASISSTNAQRQFGDVLRRAYADKEHIVIEQNGLPLVVMISISEYEVLMADHGQAVAREARAREFGRLLAAEAEERGITEEKLMEDMKEVRKEVYKKRYGNPPSA